MRRYLTFTVTLAAALGFATVGWTQSGGGGGGAGSSGSAGAGASGSAGAGGSGSAAAGANGTAGTAGSGIGTAGTGLGGTGSPGTGVTGNAATGASGATGSGIGTSGTGLGGTGTGSASAGTSGAATGAGSAGNATAAGTSGSAGTSGTTGTATGVGGTAAASTRGGIGSGNISQSPFFSDRGVRQQLNLNDNQFNTLNRAYQDAYGTYSQGVNNLNSNLTPQQRAAQMQNLENSFNNSFNRSLDSTITDPQARNRFSQLNRQFMGFNAFNDPALQRQLNLTPQQQTQIRQLASQWRQQIQKATQGTGTGTNNANLSQDQWNTLMSGYYQQLNGLLTPQQQQTWSQLTGQQYNFPASLYLNQTAAAAGAGQNGVNTVRPNQPSANAVLKNGTAGGNSTALRSGSTANGGAAATGGTTRSGSTTR
ncbi:MAG: hypothetical protein U0805_14990 [Pirellulales bacterium]